uniref:Retrovirus-related Pol polyprotein from transposon TNT 1-94-like beta-barrel domain-containing protein n=1 Tax=Timema monikensis TaxID=170555 RepID=A0A7R9E2W4_9NEOP|nr:unnamed protein product [Timema monikensis]
MSNSGLSFTNINSFSTSNSAVGSRNLGSRLELLSDDVGSAYKLPETFVRVVATHFVARVDGTVCSCRRYGLFVSCVRFARDVGRTPKEIWDKLHSLYGDTSEDAKQDCWQQFYDFRIKNGMPVATQLEKFETICKKLDDAGEKPPDSAVMSKLLNSLPSRFSAFTMAWECTAKDERKKENLIARIIREDKRLTSMEEESSSLALQVKALQLKLDEQEKMSSNYQKVNDSKDKRKKNSKSIEELKRKHPCKYCNELGHWYRECEKRMADEGKGRKMSDDSASAYVCDISAFFSETTDEDKSVWLADSGASLHMTFRRDFFSELRPVGKIKLVQIASDMMLPVAGIGTIYILAEVHGKKVNRKLTNVLLVPDLKRNLFSVGAINDKNFSFHSYHNHCEVRERSGALSAKGVRHGSLFRMLFEVQVSSKCNVAEVNSLKLWHERLGHINDSAWQELEEIFGHSDREPTLQDLRNMKYMERCIQETLRLFPSAPAIGRKLQEDLQLGKNTIPAGCEVLIPIITVHRMKEHYPNPNEFNPDNFLPDRVQERHPYVYIPFSAGPRNCVAQKFAMIESKVIISTVLRQFRVEPITQMRDINLTWNVTLRSTKPLIIKLTSRMVWIRRDSQHTYLGTRTSGVAPPQDQQSGMMVPGCIQALSRSQVQRGELGNATVDDARPHKGGRPRTLLRAGRRVQRTHPGGSSDVLASLHYGLSCAWHTLPEQSVSRNLDLLWRREVPLKCTEVLYKVYFVQTVTYAAETSTVDVRNTRKVEAMGTKSRACQSGEHPSQQQQSSLRHHKVWESRVLSHMTQPCELISCDVMQTQCSNTQNGRAQPCCQTPNINPAYNKHKEIHQTLPMTHHQALDAVEK